MREIPPPGGLVLAYSHIHCPYFIPNLLKISFPIHTLSIEKKCREIFFLVVELHIVKVWI